MMKDVIFDNDETKYVGRQTPLQMERKILARARKERATLAESTYLSFHAAY